MSGSDRFKRSFLLWLGVGCASLSHWFLWWVKKYQNQQAETLSDRQAHQFHFNSAEPFSSHSADSEGDEGRGLGDRSEREHLRDSYAHHQERQGLLSSEPFPPLQLSAQKLRLVVLLFTKIRNVSLFLLFASLIGNELSHIYFGGHTGIL
jgi:hypothetical protein